MTKRTFFLASLIAALGTGGAWSADLKKGKAYKQAEACAEGEGECAEKAPAAVAAGSGAKSADKAKAAAADKSGMGRKVGSDLTLKAPPKSGPGKAAPAKDDDQSRGLWTAGMTVVGGWLGFLMGGPMGAVVGALLGGLAGWFVMGNLKAISNGN